MGVYAGVGVDAVVIFCSWGCCRVDLEKSEAACFGIYGVFSWSRSIKSWRRPPCDSVGLCLLDRDFEDDCFMNVNPELSGSRRPLCRSRLLVVRLLEKVGAFFGSYPEDTREFVRNKYASASCRVASSGGAVLRAVPLRGGSFDDRESSLLNRPLLIIRRVGLHVEFCGATFDTAIGSD